MESESQDAEISASSVVTPDRLMRRAGFVMHKAGQRGMLIFNRRLANLGIEVRHYGVLGVLMEAACSQVMLSEALRVDRTSVVQLIDELEEKELVRRTVNPEDRRAHLVKITKRGRRVLLAADERALAGDDEFMEPLTAAEKIQLLSLLLRLV